ncbi:hypothetical protein CVS40_7810 [Lucilia cuprina]|nr:hypothetical protein CVS40_7810 [Lucilia cuprina]
MRSHGIIKVMILRDRILFVMYCKNYTNRSFQNPQNSLEGLDFAARIESCTLVSIRFLALWLCLGDSILEGMPITHVCQSYVMIQCVAQEPGIACHHGVYVTSSLRHNI